MKMNITSIYLRNFDKIPENLKELYEDYKNEALFGDISEIANKKWEYFVEGCERDFVKRMGEVLFKKTE